jgi:hypothetical protein
MERDMNKIDSWSSHASPPAQTAWTNFLTLILGFSCALAVTGLILYASVWVVQKDLIEVTASESIPAP